MYISCSKMFVVVSVQLGGTIVSTSLYCVCRFFVTCWLWKVFLIITLNRLLQIPIEGQKSKLKRLHKEKKLFVSGRASWLLQKRETESE